MYMNYGNDIHNNRAQPSHLGSMRLKSFLSEALPFEFRFRRIGEYPQWEGASGLRRGHEDF
jgi:hypothetical protein